MNFPYRKYLRLAKECVRTELIAAGRILEPLGISIALDENYPWKGRMRDAVGVCHPSDEDASLYMVGIHHRAIYDAINEQWSSLLLLSEDDWEEEISSAIRTTVRHEAGHAIYRHFLDLTANDDDLWDWCVARGFDRTLFSDECEDAGYEERMVEAFATEYGSALGDFVEKFTKEYATSN